MKKKEVYNRLACPFVCTWAFVDLCVWERIFSSCSFPYVAASFVTLNVVGVLLTESGLKDVIPCGKLSIVSGIVDASLNIPLSRP